MKTYNTILLKSFASRQDEAIAHEIITPGQILEVRTDGKVQKNTAAGKRRTLIAVEDDLQGRTIGTNYAAGDLVFTRELVTGDWAFLFVAPGVAYAKGEKLAPNGAGILRKAVAASGLVVPSEGGTVVLPDEATFEVIDPEGVDLSAGGAVATRIAVRVL